MKHRNGYVYRDGNSEYLLNKTPCRLRDIQNLFADTGIARAAYSMMEQGKIDMILLVDVYHEMWHPGEMLRSIRRSLKPDGELVLVEYRKEDRTIQIADTHRMSVVDVRAEVQAEGFTFDKLIPGLPRQHIIVFRSGRS